MKQLSIIALCILTALLQYGCDKDDEIFSVHNAAIGESKNADTTYKIIVIPNPCDSFTNFQLHLVAPSNVTISLMNAFGQIVYKQNLSLTLTGGDHILGLETKPYPSGIYYAFCDLNNRQLNVRVVIVH